MKLNFEVSNPDDARVAIEMLTQYMALYAPVQSGSPISQLGLGTCLENILKGEGICSVGDLCQCAPLKLLALPRLGRNSMDAIRKALAVRGLALEGETA